MSYINNVRYFFYKGNVPKREERLRRMLTLAYRTARDQELHPKAVLIRGDVHDTTTIDGVRQKDPRGWHVTFSYKNQDHKGQETHVACHGYVKDKNTLEFREATQEDEKPDSTLIKTKKEGVYKFSWPDEDALWEAPEIGYTHTEE